MPIILCMIVKDEAPVLQRCLDSALPIIDAACICDTGSTDDTPAIAERLLADAGKPLRLCRHEWVNFGVNRSQSFTETRKFAEDLGWDLDRSYGLFLDADMILGVSPTFKRDELTASSYTIRQSEGSLQNDRLRLAKLSHAWRSVGATHDYWTASDASATERLLTAWIVDMGDGGSTADTIERDIRLLEAELEEMPDDPRTIFYLAQSYYAACRYHDARRLYQRRAGMQGAEEEGWYAAFRLGMCSLRLDEWHRAAGELLNAWQRRPARAEPLYELSREARQRGESHVAMLTAEKALDIPIPPDDSLLIDSRAYQDGPIEEISISAYYTGDQEQGMAACDALLHSLTAHAQVKAVAARNSVYYARTLPRSGAQRVDIPYACILPTYSPSVGSICRTSSGYVMANRTLNYFVGREGPIFVPRDPDGKYFSKTVWLNLDRHLNVTSAALVDDTIIEQVALLSTNDARISGIEDIRLIRWSDEWWFTGNSSQFHPRNGSRTVIGRIDPDEPRFEHLRPLQYAKQQDIEKNWAPFIHEGHLLLLYTSGPTLILEPDPESGHCREVHRSDPPADLSRLSNSSPLVPVGDGRYHFVVHEAVYLGERRIYLHRFAEMDSSLTITRLSHPFTYQHLGIEYCCGLCLSHNEQDYIISCSWQERESWLITISRQQLEQMLIPLEELTWFGNAMEPAVDLMSHAPLAPETSPAASNSASRRISRERPAMSRAAARTQRHRRWPQLGRRKSG